jgi:methanogenic corrinoid protein MtbC1
MSIESGPRAKDAERLAMLTALVNGDVRLAYRLAVDLLAQGLPFDDIAVDVLAPVQAELGRRWAAGDLGVADEHAASAVIDELLVRLATTVERPQGPAVVVTSAEHDAHALGARVVACAFALEGFRVTFLGASVPASDLGDFLDLQRPLALALSCSMPTAFVAAARSVAAAHALGIPVVGGGRALANEERAARLGIDALARLPRDAVRILRAWDAARPERFADGPQPIPETAAFTRRSHALVSAALGTGATGHNATLDLADELHRLLRILEGALLIQEPEVIDEQVRWLRDTGPAHGYARAEIDTALDALAGALDGDLERAGLALRRSLR